jgi:sugar lactone lactonase YvrE
VTVLQERRADPVPARYRHIRTIAGEGSAGGLFEQGLRGLAVDAAGRVVAVGDSAVRVLDEGGNLLASWTTEGSAHSVAVDASGRVLVGEVGRVEVFDPTGELLSVLSDAPRLGRVTALAPLADGLLVADASARCLRRYGHDGAHVADIGKDNRMKGFLIPNGVLDFAVDDRGVIHAANPGKHRVESYTLDGEYLGYVGRFDGRAPEGFAGCCNPTNVTVLGHDRIFVTEKAKPRAKVLDAEGHLLAVIATDAFDPNCKNMDLAVGADGRVLVADTARRQILVFEPVEAHGEATGRPLERNG